MNTGPLLTTSEVADLFRVNSSQVRRWVKSRLLRPTLITPGGHYRFTQADIDAFTPRQWRSVDQHTGTVTNIPGQLTIDGEKIVAEEAEEREA